MLLAYCPDRYRLALILGQFEGEIFVTAQIDSLVDGESGESRGKYLGRKVSCLGF